MAGGIYLVQDDGGLVEMSEQPYDSEDVLQRLLANYPNLLAGDQMDSDEPRRWLLVKREMALPSDDLEGGRWAVDHLFLDQDGIPTLVEVKRRSDTRLRREVVGQLLEYAANAVVYWPVERIISEFESSRAEGGPDPEQALRDLLGDDDSADGFWERVGTNLKAGRVRLVFVADVIPPELRRIVEFLNEQMDPADVFAVEVKQFVGGELKTLVPRLIGATERKRTSRTRVKRKWTEEGFFAELQEKNGSEITIAVRKLLAELRAIDGMEIRWGTGGTTGSFGPRFRKNGRKYQLFVLYTFKVRIEFGFGVLANRPEFAAEERREALRDRLNKIDGFDVPRDSIGKYPHLPVEPLQDDVNRAAFMDVIRWLVEEIRQT